MNQQKRFGFFTAILAALLFSTAAPLGKPLLAYLNDFQFAGLLYLGASLGVSLILIRQKTFQFPWKLQRRDSFKLIGAIIFGGILGPVFLMAGLRLAAAASVSLWLNLEMLATLVIGALFFDDHLSQRGWVASTGVVLAAALLAWGEGIAGVKAGGLIALACICWGIDNHLTALIDGITPSQSTFWKGLFAGSVNLILGLLIGGFSANGLQTIASLGLGAFAYGLSILLYITSAQHLGATRSQLLFSSAPFFGLILSIILGESLTLIQGIAFFLFGLSIFSLFRETHAHTHRHEPFSHTHTHHHPDPHHTHKHPELNKENLRHTHPHEHKSMEHDHPHWPDLHHRHEHS
jgi:drug/metabolite transporter (DMT)-like permease